MEPVEGAAPEVERSDAELIAAVRAGDQGAYATLWTRHEAAARRLAHQLARPADADELVGEAFYRVLRAINGGGGPDGAFRPYLLATLRRVNIDTGRAYHQRVNLTDDDTTLESVPAESAADAVLRHDEDTAVWRAWASLPEASRTLLWHLLVEEETPAQIAPLLGTTPNGVSSRAVRAKERLRQAFLQQHVQSADSQHCEWTRRRLGEYVRKSLSERSEASVEAHLKSCERCKAAALYLTDINQALRVAVVPVVLGGAVLGAKYLAAGGIGHAAGHFGWLGAVRPRGKAATSATAGAAAAAVLAAALVAMALTGGEDTPHHGARPAVITPAGDRPARAAVPPPVAAPAQTPPRPRPTTTPHTSPTTARTLSTPAAPPPPATTPERTPTTHRTRPAPPSRSTRAASPTPRTSSTSPSPPPPPRTTPTPTSSSPMPSPTSSSAPTSLRRSTRLTLERDWFIAFTTQGWTIRSVHGLPSGSTCDISRGGRLTFCRVAPDSPGPYQLTVVTTAPPGTGTGYLLSNADPRRSEL